MNMKIDIRGNTWNIKLLSSRTYVRKFGNDSQAITLFDDREISFDKQFLNPSTVLHELIHALVFESHINSSELTGEQTEELICELVGEYFPKLHEWCHTILTYMLRKEFQK